MTDEDPPTTPGYEWRGGAHFYFGSGDPVPGAIDTPHGMWAPELHPSVILDTASVAKRIGVEAQTVRVYLTRGTMPAPQGRIGGSPWWSPAIIDRWRGNG